VPQCAAASIHAVKLERQMFPECMMTNLSVIREGPRQRLSLLAGTISEQSASQDHHDRGGRCALPLDQRRRIVSRAATLRAPFGREAVYCSSKRFHASL